MSVVHPPPEPPVRDRFNLRNLLKGAGIIVSQQQIKDVPHPLDLSVSTASAKTTIFSLTMGKRRSLAIRENSHNNNMTTNHSVCRESCGRILFLVTLLKLIGFSSMV